MTGTIHPEGDDHDPTLDPISSPPASRAWPAASLQAAGTVGTTLPADFPVIEDASLGKPLIGFGAAGPVHRTPVIFIHGNNDTPFPTDCNPFGRMQALRAVLRRQRLRDQRAVGHRLRG